MCNFPCGSSLGARHCVPLSTVPPDLAAAPSLLCAHLLPPEPPDCAGMLRDVCHYTSCWWAGPGPLGLERLAAACHRLCLPRSSLDNILVLLAAETVSCSVLTHVSRSGAFGLTSAGLCTPHVYHRLDQEPMRRLGLYRAGQKKKKGQGGGGGFLASASWLLRSCSQIPISDLGWSKKQRSERHRVCAELRWFRNDLSNAQPCVCRPLRKAVPDSA